VRPNTVRDRFKEGLMPFGKLLHPAGGSTLRAGFPARSRSQAPLAVPFSGSEAPPPIRLKRPVEALKSLRNRAEESGDNSVDAVERRPPHSPNFTSNLPKSIANPQA